MTKIIAFEGIDGTGKTVQLQRLYEHLVSLGLRVKTRSFPMYDTFFGAECGRLLSGSGGVRANEVDQRSMALWYALDRFEAFQHFDFSDADVLLINRYVLSNAVYQSVRDRDLGKPDLLDFVLELEYNHFRIPAANAHIVLDMNSEQAYENVGKKGFREYVGDQPDIYEALPEIQKRARQKYIEYAARMPNVHIIPCMEQNQLKSIEAIGSLVTAAIADLLGGLLNCSNESRRSLNQRAGRNLSTPVLINSVTIDCLHPKKLAVFYKDFLDWEIKFETDDFVSLSAAGFAVRLGFQRNEDYLPPVWPEQPDRQQQMVHLDFKAASKDEMRSLARLAVDFGASIAEDQFSEDWIVLIDPEGHPFCIDTL